MYDKYCDYCYHCCYYYNHCRRPARRPRRSYYLLRQYIIQFTGYHYTPCIYIDSVYSIRYVGRRRPAPRPRRPASRLGGTQTGSYQTRSYQKGRFIPPKPKLSYLLLFDYIHLLLLLLLLSSTYYIHL